MYDVNISFELTDKNKQKAANLEPKLLVQGACNEATFEENPDAFFVPFLDLEVQVILPRLQLISLQWFHVEIRSFQLFIPNERKEFK